MILKCLNKYLEADSSETKALPEAPDFRKQSFRSPVLPSAVLHD